MWSDLQRRTAVDKWVNLPASCLGMREQLGKDLYTFFQYISTAIGQKNYMNLCHQQNKGPVSYSLYRRREPRRTTAWHNCSLASTMRAHGIHLTHTRFQLVLRPLASQLQGNLLVVMHRHSELLGLKQW